jgi:PAS domain S-box-containing protein
MATLLFLAMGIGLLPNPLRIRLDARAKICESLAIQLCTVPQDQIENLFRTMGPIIVKRNPEILSMAIFDKDDQLLVATDHHDAIVKETKTAKDNPNYIRVPLFSDEQQFAAIEICMTPVLSKGIYGYIQTANAPFVLFMVIGAFLVYRRYLKTVLRHLDPSSVVPDRVKTVLDTLSESVVVADKDERIVFANEAFSKTISQSEASFLGHKLSFLPWVQTKNNQTSDDFPWTKTLRDGAANRNSRLLMKNGNDEDLISIVNSTPIIGPDGQQKGIMTCFTDVTELEHKNKELITISHSAGMAEVATNVLHNVGNVLNNVNTYASLIAHKIDTLKLPKLKEAIQMIIDHSDDLGAFFTNDPRGKHIPSYLKKTTDLLIDDQKDVAEKMKALKSGIEHINEIIRMQQSYAKVQKCETPTSIREIVENAIAINTSLQQSQITVVREFGDIDNILIDRAKVLQVLVNLVKNSTEALAACRTEEKILTIRSSGSNENLLRIEVSDNGIGITPEQQTKIFRHGFTTKSKGSGFGLHSSALTAKELGGTLTVHSEGQGCGATFILELPIEHKRQKNESGKTHESTNISH